MARTTIIQDSPAGNACPVPFTFQDHQIRTVMVDAQPWFVARDVSKALGITWCGRTLAQVPDEWATMCNLHIVGKKREVKIIAEPAVYKLAFRSNKPEADAFTNWVASEVLPAIRKTGQYAPAPIGQLTPAQCRHLHDVLDAKVGTLPKEAHRAAYAEAWTRFNRHFRIAKYAQLPQGKFSDALAYLINMKIVAGSPEQTAKKELPGSQILRPRHPNPSQIEALTEAVKSQGSEMHKAMDNLWAAIWPDYGRYGGDHGRFVSMSQLRYVSEDIFRIMSNNIEACRRMASTVCVNYRELCILHEERG